MASLPGVPSLDRPFIVCFPRVVAGGKFGSTANENFAPCTSNPAFQCGSFLLLHTVLGLLQKIAPLALSCLDTCGDLQSRRRTDADALD